MQTTVYSRAELVFVSGPLLVVVEYAALDNLRQFLQDRRPGIEQDDSVEPGDQLSLIDLLSFCYQVSKGMEFLSSRKVTSYAVLEKGLYNLIESSNFDWIFDLVVVACLAKFNESKP